MSRSDTRAKGRTLVASLNLGVGELRDLGAVVAQTERLKAYAIVLVGTRSAGSSDRRLG
jgi:hypothetical protein